MRDGRYAVWVVILAAVVLLNLPLPVSMRFKEASRDNIAPFQNGMSLVIERGREWVRFLVGARQAVRQKETLLVEIAELRARIRGLRDAGHENTRLRRQLGFAARAERNLIPCRVVLRGDMSGWWQTVRVNKGRSHGIMENRAVIAMDGLIGKAIEVSDTTCEVLLITDPNSRVSCQLPRLGVFGVLRGAGVSVAGRPRLEVLMSAEPCRMDYIPKDADLKKGDRVITSGLGGVFPEGIPVGEVGDVKLDESGLYLRAQVVPAADLSVLRYVFVIGEGEGPAVPDAAATNVQEEAGS